MKNSDQGARRSHRKSAGKGVFTIDSKAAILEFLRFKPESITSISCPKKDAETFQSGLLASGLSEQVLTVTENGQPCLAQVKLQNSDLDSLVAAGAHCEEELLIALDHITDPRNLGAVVRTAAFFGVRGIIVPQDRQVLLSQASVSTAMGGFAACDLVVVVNLKRALKEMQSHGYKVFGADGDGLALERIALPKKRILVLGNEEKGLSPSLKAECDQIVAVQSNADSLESLNVSVAAGILIHQFKI